MTHCWSQLLTSVCTFVLYKSSEWLASWLPPTEVHAEAESENHAENIGNVFVHRPQEPIPNSWHITRQSYSIDRPADSFFVYHWLGDFFFFFLKLLYLGSYFYFFPDLWAMINAAIFWDYFCVYIFFYQLFILTLLLLLCQKHYLFWHKETTNKYDSRIVLFQKIGVHMSGCVDEAPDCVEIASVPQGIFLT